MNLKAIRIMDESARARQLRKSLQVWEGRLKENPNDKKVKANVELRRKQLEELSEGQVEQKLAGAITDIPTIKNAKDLYKFAEALGVNIKGTNGKLRSTEDIKSDIALQLWERENPGKEMPLQVSPMLIKDITSKGKEFVDKEFTPDKVWLEHKINGQRFIMVLNPDGSTKMTSRDRSVKTFRYSELDDKVLGLQNLISPFDGRCVFDGEIINDIAEIDLPSGVHTTSTLQSTVAVMHMKSEEALKFQRENNFSLRYKVFDMLECDGVNIEKEPYEKRKEITAVACEKLKELNPDCSVDFIPAIKDYKSAWETFQQYVEEGGEGLIAKYRNAPYEQGKRSKGQWKLKGRLTVDGFVTGFVPASEDKSLKDYIGGLVFSTNYHGKETEIAAISNIDMATRKSATIYDEEGNPTLNPDWLGKCAELTGQNFKKGSMRLGSARISEWRDDKNPEDCELQDEMIRYDQ